MFAFVNKNLPAVHLDGGQCLEGDAHHLVEADPGQVGRHALDARPEGFRVIQVLNFKISQLLASKVNKSSSKPLNFHLKLKVHGAGLAQLSSCCLILVVEGEVEHGDVQLLDSWAETLRHFQLVDRQPGRVFTLK